MSLGVLASVYHVHDFVKSVSLQIFSLLRCKFGTYVQPNTAFLFSGGSPNLCRRGCVALFKQLVELLLDVIDLVHELCVVEHVCLAVCTAKIELTPCLCRRFSGRIALL